METINLHIFTSRRDAAGNCYTAFTAHNPENGKCVSGTISGGVCNVRSAELAVRGRWPYNDEPRWYVTEAELKIREFNREVKGVEYAGCTGKDILAFIRAKIG